MPFSRNQLQHLEKRLTEERARVMRDLGEFANKEASDDLSDRDGDLSKFPTHAADMGTDVNDEEVDASIATRQSAELMQIDEALDRIHNNPDQFGICENTGEQIPFERLDIIPWAKTTVESASPK